MISNTMLSDISIAYYIHIQIYKYSHTLYITYMIYIHINISKEPNLRRWWSGSGVTWLGSTQIEPNHTKQNGSFGQPKTVGSTATRRESQGWANTGRVGPTRGKETNDKTQRCLVVSDTMRRLAHWRTRHTVKSQSCTYNTNKFVLVNVVIITHTRILWLLLLLYGKITHLYSVF